MRLKDICRNREGVSLEIEDMGFTDGIGKLKLFMVECGGGVGDEVEMV